MTGVLESDTDGGAPRGIEWGRASVPVALPAGIFVVKKLLKQCLLGLKLLKYVFCFFLFT